MSFLESFFRCKCTNYKRLKPDGKSCDWTGYTYAGYDKMIILTKLGSRASGYVETSGSVISLDHDYKTNTIFFSNKVVKIDGSTENSIFAVNPTMSRMKKRIIVNGMNIQLFSATKQTPGRLLSRFWTTFDLSNPIESKFRRV